MTNQELNRLYEERLNTLAPYIRTFPNEDMAQEARIGMYLGLKDDPNANNTYLKLRSRWKVSNSARKGTSVDNGFWKRHKVKMIHYDHAIDDGVFSIIFKNRMTIPLDELVIDKIGLERFFEQLTELEKRIVNFRLDGWTNQSIMKKLKISYCRMKEIKRGIRFKISLAFAE